jgi:Flp pilus assembly protein TadD
MKHLQLRASVLPRTAPFFLLIALATQAAPCYCSAAALLAQSDSKAKRDTQSRREKLANPLNDLLDEAQRDMDANNFEAAVAPLQKFIAEKPDLAFAHFQLGYAYTALKRSEDARAEYERAIALDPKMSEAHLNLGILLLDKQQ